MLLVANENPVRKALRKATENDKGTRDPTSRSSFRWQDNGIGAQMAAVGPETSIRRNAAILPMLGVNRECRRALLLVGARSRETQLRRGPVRLN